MHFPHCFAVCFDISVPDVAYVQWTKAQPVFSQPTSIVLLSCFPSASSSRGLEGSWQKRRRNKRRNISSREWSTQRAILYAARMRSEDAPTRSQNPTENALRHEVTLPILRRVSRAENRASAQIRGLGWLLSNAKSSGNFRVEYKFENYKPLRRWHYFRQERAKPRLIRSVFYVHQTKYSRARITRKVGKVGRRFGVVTTSQLLPPRRWRVSAFRKRWPHLCRLGSDWSQQSLLRQGTRTITHDKDSGIRITAYVHLFRRKHDGKQCWRSPNEAIAR